MKIAELTSDKIGELVSKSMNMLENGDFPDMRLENDGPDWNDESFIAERSANLKSWANSLKVAD